MFRKHRLNQSSSNKEHDNNRSPLSITENNRAMSITTENDNNTMENEKPNIELQKSNANKRQRATTNMDFNEDI